MVGRFFSGPEFPDVGRGVCGADGNGLCGVNDRTAAGSDHEIRIGFQSQLYAFSGMFQSWVCLGTAKEFIGNLRFRQYLAKLV